MEMNREYKYRDHVFDMKIELNDSGKDAAGKIWHTLMVSSQGFLNYYEEYAIDDSLIHAGVISAQKHAKYFVDRIENITNAQTDLISLGFKA